MEPTFFQLPSELRKWFEKYHTTADELWVGYYKKKTGRASITWAESVDEAQCYGWIDNIRKSIDDSSYKIRFTPRRPGSVWSEVNIRRAQALIEQGLMQTAGLKAFQARRPNKTGIYSYEQRRAELEEPYNAMLMKNLKAWDFFQSQTPSYRKAVSWWIISAIKEETRIKRLEKLEEYSARGEMLPEMMRKKPAQGI